MVWDEGSQKQWYIGFIISELPDTVIIDHLERKSKDCHDTWQRPPVDDMQTANIIQIIPCPVQGDWEFFSRISHYVLENSLSIAQKVFEHWKYIVLCYFFSLFKQCFTSEIIVCGLYCL